jgi:hypothetical protein
MGGEIGDRHFPTGQKRRFPREEAQGDEGTRDDLDQRGHYQQRVAGGDPAGNPISFCVPCRRYRTAATIRRAVYASSCHDPSQRPIIARLRDSVQAKDPPDQLLT